MKGRVVAFTLAIGVLAASSAFAQSDLGLKNFGFTVGFVSPENLDGTVGFGMFLDHGTIAPRFGLESRIEYWGWSDNAFGVRSSINDVAVGARTKYYFKVTNPKVRPFAGAGLAVHFLGSKVNFPASGGSPAFTVKGSDSKLGLDLGGGVATSVSPRSDLFGEMWYGAVSDFNQFSIRAGMTFKVGGPAGERQSEKVSRPRVR